VFNVIYGIQCSPCGLKIMVFWDVTSCGLVCSFEEYGVVGCNIMWFGM
jgi:hypothetical protein